MRAIQIYCYERDLFLTCDSMVKSPGESTAGQRMQVGRTLGLAISRPSPQASWYPSDLESCRLLVSQCNVISAKRSPPLVERTECSHASSLTNFDTVVAEGYSAESRTGNDFIYSSVSSRVRFS